MKKLFFIAILVTVGAYSCFSQSSMLSSLYKNYLLYHEYTTLGPEGSIEPAHRRLAKGTTLYFDYMAASFAGETDTMALVKSAFDSLYGKTHATPDITLDAASAFQVDSISFDGGTTWINYVYPKDSIDAWIAAADLSLDSTIMASQYDISDMIEFADTSGIIATEYDLVSLMSYSDTTGIIATEYDINDMVVNADTAGTIATEYDLASKVAYSDTAGTIATEYDLTSKVAFSDTVGTIATEYDLSSYSQSTDSTWESTTQDSIHFPDAGLTLHSTTGSNLKVSQTSGGTGYLLIDYQIIESATATNLQLDFGTVPTSTTPTILPRANDPSTGFTWCSDNKLGIVGAGNSTFTSEYNTTASKSISTAIDSFIVTGGINAETITIDSIQDNYGWHRYLLSYNTLPAATSVRTVSAAGAQAFATLEEDLDDYESASLTDGAPTEAEINAALSTDPSTAGQGARYLVKDSDGTELLYIIWSDGTDWWYEALTKAL